MKTTDNLPNNTAMAPPTADAEKIATKGKEAKDKEAKDLKAKKEKEEIDTEGITLQSVPYDVAMWQMYEEDGSN
ncbi:hypothetical protein MRS44_009549 [Fusarium solani]|uniref:uncharacterized protein n=1 Tax=Fusarium solani TaxID=169388 RepID=UPI0032C3F245|nr:hypothetical protein MRS44_009549 [Fusarium solani]